MSFYLFGEAIVPSLGLFLKFCPSLMIVWFIGSVISTEPLISIDSLACFLLSSETLLLLAGNSLLVIQKAKLLDMNSKFWPPPQVKSEEIQKI